MQQQYICYLAGPITGLSFDEGNDWREEAKEKLDPRIAGMSPFRGKTYLNQQTKIKDTYEDIALSSAKGITTRDLNDCRRADMVLANLATCNGKVSIGTVMEIAWARAFNVPVVVIMDKNNPHWHAMIRESVGFIVNTLEEAVHIVNAVLLPNPEVHVEYTDKV